LDIAGGVQLKLANDKILGELADWEGKGGQNLFTATTDVFEATSFKTSGVITIGNTTFNEEQLIKMLNLKDSYTKDEIDAKLGDINSALESILAIQESLIGGNA
jgi:S-adenosylhomocysteine hydrolase